MSNSNESTRNVETILNPSDSNEQEHQRKEQDAQEENVKESLTENNDRKRPRLGHDHHVNHQHTNNLEYSQNHTLFRPLFKSNSLLSDDVLSQLVSFLNHHLRKNIGSDEQYEIEGKLGMFIDLKTSKRLFLPISSEVILKPDNWYKFESNMSMQQHHLFNQILNNQVEETRGALKYKHTKVNDITYRLGSQKVRVTVDQKTGQVTPDGIIKKIKIANFNVFRPNHALDYRISINIERQTTRPPKETPIDVTRSKDRLSYEHDAVQIDLTQVKSSNSKDMFHELEVECRNIPSLISEQQKHFQKKPNFYVQQVEAFLNTIRFLSGKGTPRG